MHEETNGHARRDGETNANLSTDQWPMPTRAKVDRRPWSLAVKTLICVVATVTMLGGRFPFERGGSMTTPRMRTFISGLVLASLAVCVTAPSPGPASADGLRTGWG